MASEVSIELGVEYARHDGVSLLGDLYTPAAHGTYPALVLVHGGAWQRGSRDFYQHWGPYLAEHGYVAFAIDYRLATPDHPTYPQNVYDVKAAIQFLRGRGAELKVEPSRIGMMGDSAGGHLTAGLLADLSRRRLPMPAAAVMFSPFLDLTCAELDDRDAVRRDPFVPPQRAKECGRTYAGEHGPDARRLNVLAAPKRRWPPLLIQVGDTECLLGDSERMAESVRAAGGHCELQVWPGQVHVFPAFYPVLPEGRAAIRYIGDFLRSATAVTAAA